MNTTNICAHYQSRLIIYLILYCLVHEQINAEPQEKNTDKDKDTKPYVLSFDFLRPDLKYILDKIIPNNKRISKYKKLFFKDPYENYLVDTDTTKKLILNPIFSLDNLKTGLKIKNLLKLGHVNLAHSIQGGVFIGEYLSKHARLSYYGSYLMNLKPWGLRAQASYLTKIKQDKKELKINKKLKPTGILCNCAAEIFLSGNRETEIQSGGNCGNCNINEYNKDREYKYTYGHLIGSYSFNLSSTNDNWKNRGAFAIKYAGKFFDKKSIPDNRKGAFHDYKFYLGQLGVHRYNTLTTRYVNHFSKKENFPIGQKIALLFGIQTRNKNNIGNSQCTNCEFKYPFIYLGGSLASCNYVNNIGYFHVAIDVGGFWDNKDKKIQQVITHPKLHYFSPLLNTTIGDLRYLARIDYIQGHKVLNGELIRPQDTETQSFGKPYAEGDLRILGHLETIWFFPLKIIGFETAFLAFVDMIYLRNSQKTNDDRIKSLIPIEGLGVGIRCFYPNFIVGTTNIHLAYHPNANPEEGYMGKWSISLEGFAGDSLKNVKKALDLDNPKRVSYHEY